MEYSIEFPDYFDDYEEEIRAKGYFADFAIKYGDKVIRPTVYDAFRLAQEVRDAFESGDDYFCGPWMFVVPEVTRANIVAAVDSLAAGGFADLIGPDERAG